VELVHLVGFTIKKSVMMHGHMNVRLLAITRFADYYSYCTM